MTLSDGFAMNKARTSIHGSDSIHRSDRGTGKLHFELKTSTVGKRVQITRVAAAPEKNEISLTEQ